ncbi:hypothetical protein [Paraburkholderia sp. C35]|uniref:hypothetical protein n=1 Tax=Paraburkholderia sp. C35 TaxID=2126993 RepID=UPI0013A5B0C9|nr:hypothetical protein [Paraburkholderia sp. C35]
MRRYLVHRLAGRLARFVRGEDREPVHQWTESELRQLDHAYGVLVGLTLAAIVAILLLLINKPVCF